MSLVMWLAGALWASWLVGSWLVGASTREVVWGGLSSVVAVIGLIALFDWRKGVYFFLVWLLFEDLARKYLGNDMRIYFGKDVLVGICYFSFLLWLRRARAKAFRPPFLFPFGLFFFLGLAQVFNPNSPSLLYGLLGLKLYFYYFPLLFLGYALCRSEEDLGRFLAVNLALAGFIALLGIIQAIVGLNFLNPAVLAPELQALGHDIRYTPISKISMSRPTSVFVSDGRFQLYVTMMWVLALGAVGYLFLRRHRARYIALAGGALIFIAAVLSAGRAVFLYTLASFVVLAVAFVWGSPVHWARGRRVVRILRRTFAFVGLAFVAALWLFPSAVGARWVYYSETLSPDSPAGELGWRAWDYPMLEFSKAFGFPQWPVGYGIGTASLGVQYVTSRFGQAGPEWAVESGYGTLLLELGILGLVLWLFWTTALVRSGWRAVRRLRGSALFPVGFSILWLLFLVLFAVTWNSLTAYENFTTNAYLWLTAGILLRLPDLQAREQANRLVPFQPA